MQTALRKILTKLSKHTLVAVHFVLLSTGVNDCINAVDGYYHKTSWIQQSRVFCLEFSPLSATFPV